MFFGLTPKPFNNNFPDPTNFLSWYKNSRRSKSNKNKIICLINYFDIIIPLIQN